MNPSVNRSSESLQSPDNPQQPPEQTVAPLQPSSQPKTSATNSEETTSQTAAIADSDLATPLDTGRPHPIPAPSEPMQYRAIGLVRGQYMSSVEQFTQGSLLAADQTLIDAVLLGRVMSLVKNHLNLSEAHLWVVYPRTRKEDDKLHLQIVGVWEPDKLSQETSTQPSESSSAAEDTPAVQDSGVTDGYFSIRGEVIYQSREEEHVIVKIRQAPRKEGDKPKFFKLKLQGAFADKMVGHFWDFQVQRQGDALVIQQGQDIGSLRSQKEKKPFKGKRPPGKRPFSSQPRSDRPVAGPKRREPLPKPIKREGPPK